MNVYSFALNPELHQPSGICNLSNIDNSLMKISLIHDSNGLDENTINQLLNNSNGLDENTINQLLNNASQSDSSNFSLFLPYGYSNNNIKKTNIEKNKFYFKNIKKSITRKYLNNWSELKEFIGYNDIEIDNNEIIICDGPKIKVYATNYNALRIMSGLAGLSYSN